MTSLTVTHTGIIADHHKMVTKNSPAFFKK